jgi:hypothetical protein
MAYGGAGAGGCPAGQLLGRPRPPDGPADPKYDANPQRNPNSVRLEAAADVVRKYYALLNQLRTNMTPDGIAALMAPQCPCREQLAAITEARSHGEHYIDHVRLASLTPTRDSSTEVSILVQYDADRGGLVDRHGRPVTTSQPRKGIKRLFHVALISGRWLIASIESA